MPKKTGIRLIANNKKGIMIILSRIPMKRGSLLRNGGKISPDREMQCEESFVRVENGKSTSTGCISALMRRGIYSTKIRSACASFSFTATRSIR